MANENEREKRETLANIVAEIRRDIKLGNNYYAANLPDRIEAAWKRDEEHAVEHATRHAEAVSRDNCRDCIHNPNGKNYEVGNAAEMREALEFTAHMNDSPYTTYDVLVAVQKARAALSAPARNCDALSADDVKSRFKERMASSDMGLIGENIVEVVSGVVDFLYATEKGSSQ